MLKNTPEFDRFDPLSGFFACKRSLIQKTRRKMNAVGFKILLELLFYNKNAVIRETPIVFGERMHGNSKANILILYQFVCQVIALVTRIKSPQFISFCLIGALGLISHIIVLNIIFSQTNSFIAAHSIGFLTASSQNYLLNKKFTFQSVNTKAVPVGLQWLLYLAVNAVSFTGNTGIATVIFKHSSLLNISSVAGVLLGVIWNFYLAKLIFSKIR